jgi:hypothetical protein
MHGIMLTEPLRVVLIAHSTQRTLCRFKLGPPTNLRRRFTNVYDACDNGMIDMIAWIEAFSSVFVCTVYPQVQ